MSKQRKRVKCFTIAVTTMMAFYAVQVIGVDKVVSAELALVENTEMNQEKLLEETEMPESIEIVQDEGLESVNESDVQDIIVDEIRHSKSGSNRRIA